MISESVIDKPKKTLSPYLFEISNNQYRLLPSVRYKILRVWSKVSKTLVVRIVLVGGTTTFNYSEDSDVDVTIQIAVPSLLSIVRRRVSKYNGVDHAGPHEINYFVRDDFDDDDFDSIYDVIGNRWLKGPSTVSINLDKYWSSFNRIADNIDAESAKLLKNSAKFEYLRHLSSSDTTRLAAMAREILEQIDTELHDFSELYKQLKQARISAFLNATPQKLKAYQSKNALPANVIYLLLRRYCYLTLLHRLQLVRPTDSAVLADVLNTHDLCKEKQIEKHQL